MNSWYVISGPTSSGKTTLINELSKMGYLTVPEISRMIIDEEIKKGKAVKDIRKDEIDFQKRTLVIKMKIENELPKDKIVFFDRGIPDSIAYYQLYGLDSKKLIESCKQKQYKGVFMLAQLPFERDYARIEDPEILKKLGMLLRKSYSNLGYEIKDIPAAPINERIKIILSNL
jgi:predicted ATPase